jgi:hypothetical protein
MGKIDEGFAGESPVRLPQPVSQESARQRDCQRQHTSQA